MSYEYNTDLNEYAFLVRDLDSTYGGPDWDNSKYKRGRESLTHILYFLVNNKSSTLRNIAKAKLGSNRPKERKIKSIVDEIRKFIKNNLIPKRIVEEDGFEKVYNKYETKYSLTPFGILYCVHLLSKNKSDYKIINNLSIEYKETLPKVFGKFNEFKKIFGNNYIEVIGLHNISDTGNKLNLSFRDPPDTLIDFVKDSGMAWTSNPLFTIGRWVDQISLMTYCNIMSQYYLEVLFEARKIKKNYETTYKILLDSFWSHMNDPELKKWYSEFVKEAVDAYGIKLENLNEMTRALN